MLQLGLVKSCLFDQNEPDLIYVLWRFIQITPQSHGGTIIR